MEIEILRTWAAKCWRSSTSLLFPAAFPLRLCVGRAASETVTPTDFDKIIKSAGSVIGLRLESFETMVGRRTLNKLLSTMDNDEHPLHLTLVRQHLKDLTLKDWSIYLSILSIYFHTINYTPTYSLFFDRCFRFTNFLYIPNTLHIYQKTMQCTNKLHIPTNVKLILNIHFYPTH